MLTKDTSSQLQHIARTIGQGVEKISFRIVLGEDEAVTLTPEEFNLQVVTRDDGVIEFHGQSSLCTISWAFRPHEQGYLVDLHVSGEEELNVVKIESLIASYRPANSPFETLFIPTLGLSVHHVGLLPIEEIDDQPGKLIRGAFTNDTDPGLFVGTVIPQRHLHLYSIKAEAEELIILSCATTFIKEFAKQRELSSETTWISANYTLGQALETYAEHIPSRSTTPKPPVGWNSWDYYYRTVSLDDVAQNMEQIRQDPVLSEHVEYIVVDDGWAHTEGEWFPNYRFREGIEHLAMEIKNRGFIPGIWTAPIRVSSLSKTAMHNAEILLKNEYGDPAVFDEGMYIVDPTHPLGEQYLREVFGRLYNAGFRLFKIDFVTDLLDSERFYDQTKSPYDALRHLFTIVRESVTEDSHILGCSLPEECGPGVADSGRISIDVHNQWSHVEWVMDYLQLNYWLNGRVWTSDPDFLVVRGSETSLERQTNVLNPEEHHPNPGRWRRGPVFTGDEAQTWANIVALSGGSVFLGDRLEMLNEAGRDMIRRYVVPTGISAKPLDLCNDRRASLWLKQLEGHYELTIINWSQQTNDHMFDFAEFDLNVPEVATDSLTGKSVEVQQGAIKVTLPSHGSIVLSWARS